VINRRAFLGTLAFLAPLRAAEAQPAEKMVKVGELHPGTGSEESAWLRCARPGTSRARTWFSNAGMQRAASNACRRSQRSWSA